MMSTKKIILSLILIFIYFFSKNMYATTNDFVFNPTDDHHTLYIPTGKPPFPAIILLHASGGIEKVDDYWANLLKQSGYIVYVIDSFTPRGYKDRKSIGWDKAIAAQLSDTPFAYQYLLTRSDVITTRIGLLGFSMGGYDTLRSMQITGEGTKPKLKALSFKAAASFYGICKLIDPDAQFKGPLKIFIGEKDDRANAAACKALVKAHKKYNQNIFIKTYSNAQHGFDNPAFPSYKELTDEKGEHYHIGYNQKAQHDSSRDLLEFFDNYLKDNS